MSFERSSTDRFNQDFPCQLCNERLSTENEMRYHLLTCGSKTELCPHCKKYIKRSYFAYHIDNNCANLNLFDEETTQTTLQDINAPSDQVETDASTKFEPLFKKATLINETLAEVCYQSEIKHVAEKLQFNIIVMGSPRVGKSSLINALCGNNEAKTSSSLNPCTPNTTCYVLEDNQQRHPFKINFYDTPGIESWTDRAGEKKMLELIEQTNPVCVIYCASPGSAAKLDQLHSVLDDCKKRQIFCALVCTNMWSDYKRHEVIKEFEKQLQFFGDKRDETSQSPLYRIPTKITFFGNGALCTMVNSKEYSDPDLSNQVMPVQGIDELIHGIMESLDEEKLLGWCYAVLDRRSYWEKITQKIGGFFKLRLTNLYKLITSSPEQTAMNFLAYFLNQFISEKKT